MESRHKLFLELSRDFRGGRIAYWAIFIAALFLILNASNLLGGLYASYGWVRIAHALSDETPQQPDVDAAIWAFSKARALRADSVRMNSALGIAYSLRGDYSTANDIWHSNRIANDLVVQVGSQWLAKGDWDSAIHYYLGAAGQDTISSGWFRFGQVCQIAFGDSVRLNPENQQRCEQLFLENDRNLILSGDIFLPYAWTSRVGEVAFSESDPTSPSYMSIQGREGARGQGAGQWITVPPGATLRFSAQLRIDEPASQVRPLYIGFTKPDGSAAGNFLQSLSDFPTDTWVALERMVTLPDALDQRYRFAPVLLDGDGRVSVRQARLELIED